MANNKTRRPRNFKGVVAVLSARDRIGYEVGDVIDFVMDEADVGDLVWDDPRFEVVYIRNKSLVEMRAMVAPLMDGTNKPDKSKKRKFSYDRGHATIKNKVVWTPAEGDARVKERKVIVNQPPIIRIP